ncbi:unnamed protein product [Discula destructiva]
MITWPPKFTAGKLKQIARLCGKSRSGTKSAITDRIVDDLRDFKPLAPGTRILSIDLGIRNLAYSLLEVPGSRQETSTTKKRREPEGAVSIPPILHAWERLALIPKAAPPCKAKKKKRKGRKTTPEDATLDGVPLPVVEDADAPVASSKSTSRKSKKPASEQEVIDAEATALAALEADPTTTLIHIEDFSPTRLSALAVELILTRLLPLKPDIVILEQQRFRSMGASSVFEWTLRVNSLESMLYAVFTTLRQLGQWPGGKVEGVVARNVLEFMAVQEGEGASIWVKEMKGDNKRIKKDIVRSMLAREGDVLVVEGRGVGEVVKEYVDKWEMKGKRGKAVTGGAEGLKKLDDLADCLLQGIAFIRWQENKRRLLLGGVEALEDQMVDE